MLTQHGVIAPLFVRIQRQVVGQQIDIVRKQQRQSLLHPAGDAAVLAAPEQAVVNQQRIRAFIYGSLNECFACSHARDDFFDLGASFHLQTVGAVVLEQLRLQQLVAQADELVSLCHVSGAGLWPWGVVRV